VLLAGSDDAQARVVALRRALGEIIEATAGANTDDEHDPEGATIAFERAQVQALLDQAQRRVSELDRALERLDAGSYGVCTGCGEPIADARLDARPSATTCIRCASRRP